MFRSRLFSVLSSARRVHKRAVLTKIRQISPVTVGVIAASCQEKDNVIDTPPVDTDSLEHEFLIRQATTVNVNAATQLLTVTLVAIQDTSERVRDALTKEICLVQQALEWGAENTPPQHWDQLVAVRGALCDLKHNLRILFSYMEYAERLATITAEISYLSGNVAASDAICERINHATRSCDAQKNLTHNLQQESLELQQQAIVMSPNLEEKLKQEDNSKSNDKPNTKT